jgi:hypothetical protein
MIERRVLVLDHAKVEAAEASIDKFIASRASSKDKANGLAMEWAASERRHLEKLREANRELWLDFHLGQAARLRRTMQVLVERHERAAARLLEESGGGGAR